MKRFFWLVLAVLLPVSAAGQPRDFSSLYDREKLLREKPRFDTRIHELFEKAIRPNLTPLEQIGLANVRFDSPPIGINREPLDFYSDAQERVVTLPVLSLLFLEDVCTAYAWLWANGYRLETVEEYVTMLKYKDLRDFGERYPPPLQALHIPANAYTNPKVSDLSLSFRNTAYAFILGHELAHVLYRHRGYRGVSAEEARKAEEQADQFGLEVMRRVREIPMGAMLFFQTVVYYWPNRADAGNMTDAQWQAYLEKRATHPLTAHRLQALASRLNDFASDFALGQPNPDSAVDTVRFIATEFSAFAKFLDDADLQRVMAVKARKSPLSSLAPRREKETLQDFPVKPQPMR